MTRRVYARPPIEEAICEIRFEPDPSWTVAVVGRLQAAVGEEYKGVVREETLVDTHLEVRKEGKTPAVSVKEGFGRARIPTEDGHHLLTVSRDLLAINTLKPYESWENFQPRIERALSAYETVLPNSQARHVGIRYINRLSVDPQAQRPETYFSMLKASIDALPVSLCNFFHRTEHEYDDGTRLLTTHATVKDQEGSVGCILDIDVVRELASPVELSSCLAIIEDLHQYEGAAFEELITDDARELFG